MYDRSPFQKCIHIDESIEVRDLSGCGCAGGKKSYRCNHEGNTAQECVVIPLLNRQETMYGQIISCMKCEAYEPRPGAVVKARRQESRQEPAARAKKRKTADIPGTPTARLKRTREQREFEEGMLCVGSG